MIHTCEVYPSEINVISHILPTLMLEDWNYFY